MILKEQLKDPKAIIVIPGSYNADGTFKHALATGYAVEQWGNKIYSDEIKDIIEQKIEELQVSNPGKIFFGNIGTEVVNNNGKIFYPQFPVGDQTWDDFENKFRANIKKISPGEKQALIKNYEINLGRSFTHSPILGGALGGALGAIGFSKEDDDNAEFNDILQHLKNTYQDNKFIHVWGANNDNWNNDLGQWGGGDGQATAFKANKDGVFAIATTPVAGTKNLMDKCKIYGAPSAHPSHPQALEGVAAGLGPRP
jgi:hypothetical protein